MMNRRTILMTSFATVIAGCAAPPAPQAPVAVVVPRFQWGQVVDFEGLSFKFNEARSTKSFVYSRILTANSESGFVIVDISVTNKSAEPLRFEFQPIYRLIDSAGRLYEHSQQRTIQINISRLNIGGATESINPGTTQRREYVFEAPKGQYELQVMVPGRLQMAFAGSVKKTGPYFLYDISSQL
jgi:hypothetical protein